MRSNEHPGIDVGWHQQSFVDYSYRWTKWTRRSVRFNQSTAAALGESSREMLERNFVRQLRDAKRLDDERYEITLSVAPAPHSVLHRFVVPPRQSKTHLQLALIAFIQLPAPKSIPPGYA